MKEEKLNTSRVTIYGQQYLIKGDVPNSYIYELANMVDQKMREIGERNPKLDHAKIAVLAALNFADEYMRLKKEFEELYRMIGEEEERNGKDRNR